MKINSFEYFGSFDRLGSFPKGNRPEVAFYGRSNVGKSSVINTLLGTQSLAFISKKPGRTGNANYFLINDRFYLVDMPGYGYARVSKDERKRWRRLQDEFLSRVENPRAIVFIMDVRRKPNENDKEMAVRLEQAQKPFCLVFNKVDKLKKGVLGKKITENLENLPVAGNVGLVPFSCMTSDGKKELWTWILEKLAL